MTNPFFEIRFGDLTHLALQRGASDIHMVPGVRPSIRVDGDLEYVDGPVVLPEETETLTQRLLDKSATQTLSEIGDASATWTGLERVILRVHAFKSSGATSLALRILPQVVPALESLHLPTVVSTFAQKTRGLIIFSGPTGSGKSTSMAALLSRINNTYARRIITIEDPVEYRHQSVRSVVAQREIGRDVPSYANAVIGALRADPDVIMLGEMRDTPTMRAAITAAETGHLVLATLHTGDAVQTIDRIVDAFDGSEQAQVRAQLSAGLVAVVCQRLLPRAGGNGRCVAAEVLIATDAVRATIRESRTHQLRNLMLTGRQAGMQTLEHHLSELLSERRIDRAAASASSDRHGELREIAGAPV